MSSPLRSLVLRGPGVVGRRPARIVGCCAKASFSTAHPVCLPRSTLQQQCRAVVVSRAFVRADSSLASSAQKSPDAASNKTSADLASKPTTAPADPKDQLPLSWDDFFKLRLKRRRIQMFFSITSSLAGAGGGAIVLSTGLAEPLVSQVPLDPFVTLGLMTASFAGMGWLLGPFVGSEVFYIWNRQYKKQMKQKESQFFARVKKYRVDPSNSSASNPVPDFYGEKIQSVAGYRRWLKDQRAFIKKKTANFV